MTTRFIEKIASSITDANGNSQVCFDTPLDSSNVLNVINKNRVKVTARRRKPTRQRHVTALVHSEEDAKTSDSETPPTKSNVDVFNENSHILFSASTIKTAVKSEPAKLGYKSQEKNKMDMMSQLVFEATSKVALKKSVEREGSNQEYEFDIVSETTKKDRSKINFSFQISEENVIASAFPIEKKETSLSKSDSFEDSNVSKSNNYEVASEVVLKKIVEKEKNQEYETNLASKVVKDEFKNNFSFLLPEENVIPFVFPIEKKKNSNLLNSDSFEGSNVSKSNNFEVLSKVVLKKAVEKEEDIQDCEINIVSEEVKKEKFKNNFSFQPPEENVIPFVFAIEKKDNNSLPESDSFVGSNISRPGNLENNDLSDSDSFEDGFSTKSVSQISTTDLPEDVGFSTFLWHIFKKSKYTDVELNLESPNGPKIFSAHKMILSLWSPYFADKFYGAKKDTEAINIIQLSDVSPEAFEAMLKFMYGYIPEFETCMKTFELYKVAIKFQVTSLINSCCQILDKIEVLPSNVFDILEISKCMQCKNLTSRCLKLIKDNTKEIMAVYKLSDISPSMIHIFLDSPKLSLDNEFDLLLWIFAWSRTRYLENSKYSSTREVLEQFLPKLNFLSLTNAEFAMLYRFQEVFFSQDEVVSIFMNIAVPGSVQMPDWYDKKHPFRIYSGSK